MRQGWLRYLGREVEGSRSSSALNGVTGRPRHRKEFSRGLDHSSRRDPGVPTPCSLVPLLTQRGRDALLQESLVFAPHGERLLYHNHVVKAVRLSEVEG
jgi:hypothetical protein